MSEDDWLVLCALSLPRLEDQFEFMLRECNKNPSIVPTPSVQWWARLNAREFCAYMKTRGEP